MSEHYFSPHKGTDPSDLGKLREVGVHYRGQNLSLVAGDKVFSASEEDLGTEQLLKKAPPLPNEGTFLDLGCGWGPVALTMAAESPAATVWAVDQGILNLTGYQPPSASDHYFGQRRLGVVGRCGLRRGAGRVGPADAACAGAGRS